MKRDCGTMEGGLACLPHAGATPEEGSDAGGSPQSPWPGPSGRFQPRAPSTPSRLLVYSPSP